MRGATVITPTALVGALMLVACSGATAAEPKKATPASLQADVNAIQAAGSTAVVAQVADHGVVISAVAGTAVYGTVTPVDPAARYRQGSVTKTFVATVILQLVGEGRMSLDDKVDRWLPGLITGNGNDGTKITVRQVLQHTSGLFDYGSDNGFLDTTLSSEAKFNANKHHQYTPQDLVAIALAHPPNFAPGSRYAYSNTDYIVAGLIIKAVTGNTWDTEVTSRIIGPLGLTGTSIPGAGVETIPAPFNRGYNIWTYSPSRVYSDTTEDNMSWADSAGAIITTAADEVKFFSALLGGRVLPAAQLTQMKTTVKTGTTSGAGLGIGLSKTCRRNVWGHNGQVAGYATTVATSDDGSVTVAFDRSTTDLFAGDPSFTTNTNAAESTLINDVFCGAGATGTANVPQQMNETSGSRIK